MDQTAEIPITKVAVRRPRILVASWLRWVESARLAAALIDIGAEVHALTSSFHPMRAVGGVESRTAYGMVNPSGSVRAAILRIRPDLIISCDDETTERMRRVLDSAIASGSADDGFIVELIARSFGDAKALAVCTSRAELMAAAIGVGVRAPPTQSIASEDALVAWVEAHGPAFLKRDGTHGGNGVAEIRNEEDARRAWRRLAGPPSPIEAMKYLIKQQDLGRLGAMLARRRGALSVQGAVSGHAANCLAVCERGKLTAYVGVEVAATLTPTGFGTIVRSSDNADMRHAAEAIARSLSLSGVFGLDFVVKQGTDEAYLIEMNPRVTPLAHFHFGPGRDPAAALCALVSHDIERRERPGSPPAQPIAVFPHMLSGNAASNGMPLLFDAPWDYPELLQLSMPLPSNPFKLVAELISRFLL